MNKNNDDFLDNILKEKALKEDVIVPDNINNIIKLTISNLPDKSKTARKGENIFSNIYKFLSKIELASIIELVLIIFALILVPTIINNHNKSYSEKRVAGNANPFASVTAKDIDFITENPTSPIRRGKSIKVLHPEKDSDKINKILNLIKSSSSIRESTEEDLEAYQREGPYPVTLEIKMKNGSNYSLTACYQVSKQTDSCENIPISGAAYKDRYILEYNRNSSNVNSTETKYYTVFSSETENYLLHGLDSDFIQASPENDKQNSSTVVNNTFDENKAISMVIQGNEGFPANQSESITKELPTGGPQGSTTKVKFTTKVEKSSEYAYVVTLIKDWGITVNGKYVKSSWKYNVTPDSITLLESDDNDYLMQTIK